MRTEGALDGQTVNLPGAGPAFRGDKHDHRIAGTVADPLPPGLLADPQDLLDAGIECRRQHLVNALRFPSLDKIRLVPVARQKAFQLLPAYAGEDGGVVNLVAVQV